ncbi:MAG: biotin--[acetyl-CoA-carboxylase] ligase [Alphaproteobacteria bacterium]|nr:biotin--[acetyl-CoA-carboxylase] ligase [Alphaproteobacteria bacterium]
MTGYKVLSFDKISSTQTYAHDMVANKTARDHTAIIAKAQFAGRGRYRRPWVSHHGNLYVSYIFSCEERDSRLAYAVAVAIVDTLASYGINSEIKWPNDVLVDGKKISGVLIEYSGHYVIVGIGINVLTNPTVAEYKTTKMANYADVNILDLFNRLSKNLDKWMVADFDSVRKRWMGAAAGLNALVKYRGEMVELIGINDSGALVVRNKNEYILIHGDEILM